MVPTSSMRSGFRLEEHFEICGVAAAGEAADLGFVAGTRAEKAALGGRRAPRPSQQQFGRECVEQDRCRRPGSEHALDFLRDRDGAAAIVGRRCGLRNAWRQQRRRKACQESASVNAHEIAADCCRGSRFVSAAGLNSSVYLRAVRPPDAVAVLLRRRPPRSRWRDSRAPDRHRIPSALRRRLASRLIWPVPRHAETSDSSRRSAAMRAGTTCRGCVRPAKSSRRGRFLRADEFCQGRSSASNRSPPAGSVWCCSRRPLFDAREATRYNSRRRR